MNKAHKRRAREPDPSIRIIYIMLNPLLISSCDARAVGRPGTCPAAIWLRTRPRMLAIKLIRGPQQRRRIIRRLDRALGGFGLVLESTQLIEHRS